jgi:hypothetical protein
MSNFLVGDPTLGYQPASATGTVPTAHVGDQLRAFDQASSSTNMGGAVFEYCRGSNVTAIGQFVHISNGSAVLLARPTAPSSGRSVWRQAT